MGKERSREGEKEKERERVIYRRKGKEKRSEVMGKERKSRGK